MTDPEETPGPRWQVASRWLAEESFWRDVTTRTLATLISALLIYVFALAAGYVGRPEVWPVVLVFLAVAVVLGLMTWLSRKAARRSTERLRERIERDAGGDLMETLRLLTQEQRRGARAEARLGYGLLVLGGVGLAVFLSTYLT